MSENVAPAGAQRAQQAAPLQFWLTALIVVILDQLSKLWIRSTFPLGATQPLIDGWLRLTHSENTGAAWGMMSGQRWLLIAVSVGVSIFILMMAREFAREKTGALPLVALGLIFGGAIGNLIDRGAFGKVTDMIDLDTPVAFLRNFPIFNLADSALTVGVLLLMLHFVLQREPTSNPETSTPKPNASDTL